MGTVAYTYVYQETMLVYPISFIVYSHEVIQDLHDLHKPACNIPEILVLKLLPLEVTYTCYCSYCFVQIYSFIQRDIISACRSTGGPRH